MMMVMNGDDDDSLISLFMRCIRLYAVITEGNQRTPRSPPSRRNLSNYASIELKHLATSTQ